jgi:hypothetical protein
MNQLRSGVSTKVTDAGGFAIYMSGKLRYQNPIPLADPLPKVPILAI